MWQQGKAIHSNPQHIRPGVCAMAPLGLTARKTTRIYTGIPQRHSWCCLQQELQPAFMPLTAVCLLLHLLAAPACLHRPSLRTSCGSPTCWKPGLLSAASATAVQRQPVQCTADCWRRRCRTRLSFRTTQLPLGPTSGCLRWGWCLAGAPWGSWGLLAVERGRWLDGMCCFCLTASCGR